ncbi:MAG: tetratricopeptide repeat protein, partial [Planctomycetota bacterium]
LLIDTMIQLTRDMSETETVQNQIDTYRELYSDDPFGLLLQGEYCLALGRDSDAIKYYDQYITRMSQAPMGYFRRGFTYYRSSRFNPAINDFQQVKRLNPAYYNYEPRLMLVKALEGAGKTEEAIAEMQTLIGENATNIPVVERLFQTYMQLQIWDSAESLINTRLQTDADNPTWYLRLAQVADARNQQPKAIESAIKAVEKSNYQPKAVTYLFSLYLSYKQFDNLITAGEKLKPDQQNRVAFMQIASAYLGKQNIPRAIESCVKSFNYPDFKIAQFFSIIRIDPQFREKSNELFDALKKRLQSQPRERASMYLLSVLQLLKGDQEASMKTAREVIQATTGNTDKDIEEKVFILREHIANVLAGQKKFDEAINVYKEILKLEPDDESSLNNLAYIIMENKKDPKSALPYAERALNRASKNANVLDTVGWNHILLGNYDQGIALLRKGIQYNMFIPALHYHLAEAFYRRSNVPDAKTSKEDLAEAKVECRRAHSLIRQMGQDTGGIFDRLISLSEKLGLTLDKNIPQPQQPAPPPT